jgi:DNA polymerase III delta prime subunit
MISKITLVGTGAQDRLVLDILKTQEPWDLVGPSESMKSMVMACVIWCITGKYPSATSDKDGAFPLEILRADSKKGEVEITLDSGTRLYRSIDKGRGGKMVQTRRENRANPSSRMIDYMYDNEDKWAAGLGGLGKNPELVRFIMSPAWRKLNVLMAGNCRAFRDMLLLPTPASNPLRHYIDATLAKYGFSPLGDTDTEDEKVAKANVTEAKKSAAAKKALVENAESRLAVKTSDLQKLTTTDIDDKGLKEANAIIGAASAWKKYDTDIELWRVLYKGWQERTQDLVVLEAKSKALEAEPAKEEDVKATLAIWKRKYSEVQASVQKILETGRQAKSDIESAEAAWTNANVYGEDTSELVSELGSLKERLSTYQNLVDTLPETIVGNCPTCSTAGYAGKNPAYDAALEGVKATKETIGRLTERLNTRIEEASEIRLERMAKALSDEKGAKERRAQALADYEVKVAESKEAVAKVEEAQQNMNAWALWKVKSDAIGAKPEPGKEPVKPTIPTRERPTPEKIKSSDDLVTLSNRKKTEVEVVGRDVNAITIELATAKKDREQADKDLVRADAILVAVRRAPSDRAQECSKSYSGMPGVEIRFPDTTDAKEPSVKLLIDGRDWTCASDGRQILAEYQIRARMRELAGMRWLPIFIDYSNLRGTKTAWPSFNGLDDKPRPVIRLVTDEDARTISVRQ